MRAERRLASTACEHWFVRREAGFDSTEPGRRPNQRWRRTAKSSPGVATAIPQKSDGKMAMCLWHGIEPVS